MPEKPLPRTVIEVTCSDGTIALIRIAELFDVHEDPIQGTIFHMSDGTAYITNQPLSHFKDFIRINALNLQKYDYP